MVLPFVTPSCIKYKQCYQKDSNQYNHCCYDQTDNYVAIGFWLHILLLSFWFCWNRRWLLWISNKNNNIIIITTIAVRITKIKLIIITQEMRSISTNHCTVLSVTVQNIVQNTRKSPVSFRAEKFFYSLYDNIVNVLLNWACQYNAK